MITAPQLFAGIINPQGKENCFYCNGICGTEYTTKNYVKDTFTNRDIILRPNSNYICGGCVCTLNERADINLANEEVRTAQKTRLYSWVFNGENRVAYTKAHLKTLTKIILNPPVPPFAIVITVAGQKQLLFRSRIAWTQDFYPMLLEDEHLTVDKTELQKKMLLASKIIAAIGKPSLEEMEQSHAIKFFEYYENLDSFYEWRKEMFSPMSRLALFLSPSQKECQIEYPKITRIVTSRLPTQLSLFD